MTDNSIENKIKELLNKSVLSETEREWLLNHEPELQLLSQEDVIISNMIRTELSAESLNRLSRIRAIINRDERVLPERNLTGVFKMKWIKYAAAIVAILFSTVSLVREYTAKDRVVAFEGKLPGSQKAVLTLADGREIKLDTLSHGKLTTEGNSDILVSETGKIEYVTNDKNANEPGFNSIKTPNGGQFKLQLSDGSKVWINAGSSITYPAHFVGNERKVIITGEVFFEVTKRPEMPFIVEANNAYIEVLGTSFNINSYENEAFSQTTLVDGKIRLRGSGNSGSGKEAAFVILKPGQQAKVDQRTADDHVKVVEDVNIDQITAWKEGIFDFDKLDLVSLMKQLEKWYDIEVEYEGKPKNITFRGKMYRNVNLSDVLDVLKKMGVAFEQKGNKLIIKSVN